MSKFGTIFANTAEIIIILVLVLGGISVMLAPPIVSSNPVIVVLGGKVAVVIYGLVFIILASMLSWSKLGQHKKMHKYTLMGIYLVCVFAFCLELATFGWHLVLLDEVVLGLLAGWLWLRWKLLTEYINPGQFRKIKVELDRKR